MEMNITPENLLSTIQDHGPTFRPSDIFGSLGLVAGTKEAADAGAAFGEALQSLESQGLVDWKVVEGDKIWHLT